MNPFIPSDDYRIKNKEPESLAAYVALAAMFGLLFALARDGVKGVCPSPSPSPSPSPGPVAGDGDGDGIPDDWEVER